MTIAFGNIVVRNIVIENIVISKNTVKNIVTGNIVAKNIVIAKTIVKYIVAKNIVVVVAASAPTVVTRARLAAQLVRRARRSPRGAAPQIERGFANRRKLPHAAGAKHGARGYPLGGPRNGVVFG